MRHDSTRVNPTKVDSTRADSAKGISNRQDRGCQNN